MNLKRMIKNNTTTIKNPLMRKHAEEMLFLEARFNRVQSKPCFLERIINLIKSI